MVIGVLEWDVASLGGRQRTMLAFADYFKEVGHEVRLISNATASPSNILNQTYLECLSEEDFHVCPLKRRFDVADQLPEALKGLDVLLCSYGGWGHLAPLLPETRVICWVIHPDQARQADTEVWTNSHTTAERLLSARQWRDSKPVVIYPPHSYKGFRETPVPWEKRKIAVLAVGSLLRAKRLDMVAKVSERVPGRTMIVAKSWPAARAENSEVATGLYGTRAELVFDARSGWVASVMRDAKVFCLPSEAESAPLCIYEALNAGCSIVARRVGAVEEQLRGCRQHSQVFDLDEDFEGCVQRALDQPPPGYLPSVGMEYDRERIGFLIRKALER